MVLQFISTASIRPDLYQEYRNRIGDVLNQTGDGRKKGLQNLVAGLVINDAAIKTALGGVNHSGLCSRSFVSVVLRA